MNYKKIIIIPLLVIASIFIVQNTESTQVSFLLYDVSLPRAILLSIVLIIGIIIGVFLPFNPKKKRSE